MVNLVPIRMEKFNTASLAGWHPLISGSLLSVPEKKMEKVRREWFTFRPPGSGIMVRITSAIPREGLALIVPCSLRPGFISSGHLGLDCALPPTAFGASHVGRAPGI